MRFSVPMTFLLALSVVATGCSGRARSGRDYEAVEVIEQKYVHKYGIPVQKNEWSNRGESGKVVSTLRTGVVVTKTYDNGYLHGETTYTFPHSGAIQRIEQYAEGQLVKEQEMHPTGAPKREVQYGRPNTRIVSLWFEDGTPRYREEYRNERLIEGDYYSLNKQVESRIDEGSGIRVNRDEFGQVISKDRFEQGVMVQRTLLYPNGSTKEIIPYLSGRVEGQRKTYLPGGEPRSVEEWSNDRQEGITTLYQNGEKIAEVPYLNGMKNGVEQRFNDGQFIVEEINWINGRKHGPSFTHLGADTHVAWYFDGNEVSKRQFDHMTNPVPR